MSACMAEDPDEPLAVVSHNKIAFYAISPDLYKKLIHVFDALKPHPIADEAYAEFLQQSRLGQKGYFAETKTPVEPLQIAKDGILNS